MENERKKPRRRQLRLKEYDYSQPGAYFVTICTHQHEKLFGRILNNEIHLNEAGCIARDCLLETKDHFQNVELDASVIMPNHLHVVIVVGAQFIAPDNEGAINRAPTLGIFIRFYKALITRKIHLTCMPEFRWQRNYYEHIIRNEKSLDRIREYVIHNPMRWELDRENPDKTGQDEFDKWLDSFKKRPFK